MGPVVSAGSGLGGGGEAVKHIQRIEQDYSRANVISDCRSSVPLKVSLLKKIRSLSTRVRI